MRTKVDLMRELKLMLNDVLVARTRGVAHFRLARAHGYVDGYMQALLDTGMATRQELLAVVAEERTELFGPAWIEQTVARGADAAA